MEKYCENFLKTHTNDALRVAITKGYIEPNFLRGLRVTADRARVDLEIQSVLEEFINEARIIVILEFCGYDCATSSLPLLKDAVQNGFIDTAKVLLDYGVASNRELVAWIMEVQDTELIEYLLCKRVDVHYDDFAILKMLATVDGRLFAMACRLHVSKYPDIPIPSPPDVKDIKTGGISALTYYIWSSVASIDQNAE